MTEELTAEEREWLLRAGRRENKLVHALDAALARAEAADKDLHREKVERLAQTDRYRACFDAKLSAESALTEAMALLVRIEKYAREDRASTGKFTRLARALDETREWLKLRTPAPAAKVETCTEAERKVLEACAALKISTDAIGPVSLNGKPQICSSTQALAAAEFARRGQQ